MIHLLVDTAIIHFIIDYKQFHLEKISKNSSNIIFIIHIVRADPSPIPLARIFPAGAGAGLKERNALTFLLAFGGRGESVLIQARLRLTNVTVTTFAGSFPPTAPPRPHTFLSAFACGERATWMCACVCVEHDDVWNMMNMMAASNSHLILH